ncbi:hypothetical protein PsYK624_067530 [Phanerochaete sordida]|uniref:DUF6533 domain-containing protein n=1 Tax=Phanerochaete sordida TaxID=48140 RepID=A0A9P3LDJ0_9APHY|nr:hypothetical protein PsYK624_067530 [Phanerochaete sordida]
MSANGTEPSISSQLDFLLECRMGAAVSALTLYEYAITFDQEVQAVWRRRWTISSLLLLSIRAVMVISAIFQLVSLLPRKAVRPSLSPVLYCTVSAGFRSLYSQSSASWVLPAEHDFSP